MPNEIVPNMSGWGDVLGFAKSYPKGGARFEQEPGQVPQLQQSLNLNNGSMDDGEGKKDEDGNEEYEEEQIVDNMLELPPSQMKKYGIIQEILIQDDDDEEAIGIKARRVLNDKGNPTETLEVEVIGHLDYRVGFGVHVRFPWYRGCRWYKGQEIYEDYGDCFMFIKEVTHKWHSDGSFTSNLVLTPSRVMDEMEWDREKKDEDEEDSGSMEDLQKRMIEYAKQSLGVPYVWGGTDPIKGMDCSGFTQHVYNHFTSETGVTLSRTTYTQVEQGKEISTTDRDSWEPCDLIFPHAGHVVMYIGDSKIIEEPHTGASCRIREFGSGEKVYAVRRILDESMFKSKDKDDDSVSGSLTSDVKSKYATKKLIKYIEQEEGLLTHANNEGWGWFIGYGTAYNTFPEAFKNGKSAASTITQKEAESYLIRYLNDCGDNLKRVTDSLGIRLSVNQFDALLDLSYIQGAYLYTSTGNGKALIGALVGGYISEQHFINVCSVEARAKADWKMFKSGVYVPYNA